MIFLEVFLIIVGVLMALRNREMAVWLGIENRRYRVAFVSSVARQNIAVLGVVLCGFGLALMAVVH